MTLELWLWVCISGAFGWVAGIGFERVTYARILRRIGRDGGSEKIAGEWFRITKERSER